MNAKAETFGHTLLHEKYRGDLALVTGFFQTQDYFARKPAVLEMQTCPCSEAVSCVGEKHRGGLNSGMSHGGIMGPCTVTVIVLPAPAIPGNHTRGCSC